MDYYHISAQELGKGAKLPILKLGDSGEVFYEMAAEMCAAIRANNAAGKPTVFICPVGPVGQYPIFVRLVNREQLSLRNCWFINMDEYLTDDGQWIAEENPLSFRGFMAREVYGKIAPELLMPEEQRVFPDPNDLGRIPALIEELGGVNPRFPSLAGYTISTREVNPIQTYLVDNLGLSEPLVRQIGCVIGTHAGPGAFGLAFFDNGLVID